MSTKKTWKKKIRVGTDADGCIVTIEVELRLKAKTDSNGMTTDLEPAPKHYTTLSISGEGKLPHTRDCAYCGQIQDTIREELSRGMKLAIDRKKLLRILEIWDKWQLNDVTAGTEKQEKALKEHYAKNKRRCSYEDACALLKRKDLYDERGYTYGTSWLLNVLPEEIKREVKTW